MCVSHHLIGSINCLNVFSDVPFLPLDEAIASGAVFVIVSGSEARVETLLDPAK